MAKYEIFLWILPENPIISVTLPISKNYIGHKYLELKPDFKGLEAAEIFRILQSKNEEEENVITKVVEDLPSSRGPRTRAAIYEPTDQKGVVDVEISPIIH